jgi:hypothetical protein
MEGQDQMKENDIARTYISRIRPRANDELDWFRRQPALRAAIDKAGLAVNSRGKRYSHQRRLSKEVLQQARELLLANTEQIARCKAFDQLFAMLEDLLLPVRGLGELYVYDTALRLGATLGRMPTKVYLHAGTRAGAKAIGFSGKEKALEVSQLPDWLRQLEPYEIEDVLCIFKDRLAETETSQTEEPHGPSWCD